MNQPSRALFGVALAVIPLVAFFSHGMFLPYHALYNLSGSILLNLLDAGLQTDASFLSLAQSTSNLDLRIAFSRYFAPWLEYSTIFFTLSLAIKSALLYLAYRFFLCLSCNPTYALLGACLFVLAPNLENHGLAHMGIWGAPMFHFASISGFFILLGMVASLQGWYLGSGCALFLAVQFHPTYAIATLIFYIPPMALVLALTDLLKLTRFVFFTCLLPVISAALKARSHIGEDFVTSHHDLSNWYAYAIGAQPDDVTIWFTVVRISYFVVPLLVIACLVSFRERQKEPLDILLIGTSLIFLVMIAIEFVHKSGVFFGKFSEFLITLEVRRGVWLPLAFGFVKGVRWLEQRSEDFTSTRALLGLCAAVATYLRPTFFGVAIVLVALVKGRLQRRHVVLVFVVEGILIAAGIEAAMDDGASGYGLLRGQFQNLAFCLIVVVTVLVATRIRMVALSHAKEVVFTTCVIFGMAGIAYGQVTERPVRELRLLFGGPFPYKVAWELFAMAEGSEPSMDFVGRNCVSKMNRGIILLPPDGASGLSTAFYGRLVFLSEGDFNAATLTPKAYAGLREKIAMLYGETAAMQAVRAPDGMSRIERERYFDEMPKKLSVSHSLLTRQQLAVLADRIGPLIYVARELRGDLGSGCRGNRYNFYELQPEDADGK